MLSLGFFSWSEFYHRVRQGFVYIAVRKHKVRKALCPVEFEKKHFVGA